MIIKIGLKNNADFLFKEMKGNCLGGIVGFPYFKSILYVNEIQFEKFKTLIIKFGGNIKKSLTKTTKRMYPHYVDYQCYFKS